MTPTPFVAVALCASAALTPIALQGSGGVPRRAHIAPIGQRLHVAPRPTALLGAHPTAQVGAHPTASIGAYATAQVGAHPTAQVGAHATAQVGSHPTAQIASVSIAVLRLEQARSALLLRDRFSPSDGGPHALSLPLMQTVPGDVAKILPDGLAAAPADAPLAVQQAIWAGNQLIGLPYVYGGGHGAFASSGYDCSGTVSFALHGGGLLAAPIDSVQMLDWADPGAGSWITVYTSVPHAFLEIAGIRLDTSSEGDPDGLNGPRWRPLLADTAGFVARHPAGY